MEVANVYQDYNEVDVPRIYGVGVHVCPRAHIICSAACASDTANRRSVSPVPSAASRSWKSQENFEESIRAFIWVALAMDCGEVSASLLGPR